MNVFLDTNIFCKKWFVNNANFKLLFYFLNNEGYDFLLSDLVVQETNNIRERELKEVTTDLQLLIKKGNKLNISDLKFDVEMLGIQGYDLNEILIDKVDSVKNIGYENISQKKVVERAIRLIKPFTGQEKGYRDTLIWLSFLSYLKENNIEGNIAFITENKSDFFESRGKILSFNVDLLEDIKEYGIKANIKPYTNIYDFVDENVDKISHSFDQREIFDELEEFLIEETENYLDSMSNHDLGDLLDAKVFSDKLTPVIQIKANIFESLEDTEVKSVKSLSSKDVYISSYFEMRRVDLIVTIDLIEYKQYADDIEAIKTLYNIEIEDNHVNLSFLLRTCIDGSFEYETQGKIASNLSVDGIHDRI